MIRYVEQFARHIAAQPWRHDRIVLELMNEPVADSAAQWRRARDRLVAAYRAGAPDLTLLIDAPIVGSDADDPNAEPYTLGLEQAGPVADPNVIYSIHFYASMLFTHQGAEFDPEYALLAHVPYPATAGSCTGVPRGGVMKHGQTEDLAAYCAGWNAATMERWISRAASWASANHARLTVGEFGAYNRVTSADARLRWIGDARRLFEQYGLGWTLWGVG